MNTLFTILLIGFVDCLGIGLVYPIFALLLFDETVSLFPPGASNEYRGFILGWLIALTPIAQVFCAPLLGKFSDRVGRRLALLLGIGVGCLGYLVAVVALWVHSIPLLFFYRLLVGVSDATGAVAQAALVDISTEETRGRYFALFNASWGLGYTLGPFLGGIIADPSIVFWFSYSTPLIAAGCMSFINLLLVWNVFPRRDAKQEGTASGCLESVRQIEKTLFFKNMGWIFFGGFLFFFGWALYNEFIPLFLNKYFLFDMGDIGMYYAISGGWYAFGSIVMAQWGQVGDRPEKTLISSLLLYIFCVVCIGLLNSSHLIWWILPWMMGALAFAFPAATALVSKRAQVDRQGELLGAYQAVGAAAMGLSPLLFGAIVGVYPLFIPWGSAVCVLAAACSFYRGQLYDCPSK